MMSKLQSGDKRRRQLSVSSGSRLREGAAILLLCAGFAGLGAATADAAEPPHLRSEALAAFDHYVELTEARNEEELRKGAPFFWIDDLPGAERAAAYAELRRGSVKIERRETRENGRAIPCKGGLIHHWIGVIFVPGATLSETLALLEDYDHHASYYAPDVERSRIESRDAEHFRVFLRFRRHKVITVVLNTQHDVRYFHDSPARAHSRSSAVRIAEVENAGKSDEREKPPGEDGGFLWKMETWWRMEERDGGTYVQSESVSLTRDIPPLLEWLIGPFVTSIPRESLTFTLEATRRGVETWRNAAANVVRH